MKLKTPASLVFGAVLTATLGLLAQPREAIASAGCNFEFREVCVVIDAGEICMPWPGGECEPIIIELQGRKNDAVQ